MATPASTTAEVDGRMTRRSCRDTLLDSLAQEVDCSPGQTLPLDKWSSEELIASCQALLEEEARGTGTSQEAPSPADDQCLPRCPHPRSQTQHCQKQMSPTDPLPPPVSLDTLLSSETLHTALPAIVHTAPDYVTSQLSSGLSPGVGTSKLAPVEGLVAKSPQVSWASRPSSSVDTITPVQCSGSQHSQHLASIAAQTNIKRHLSSSGVNTSISTTPSVLPSLSEAVPSLERLGLLQETPSHQHSCHQEVLYNNHSPSPAQQMAAPDRPVKEQSAPLARPLAEQSLPTRGQAPAEKVALGRLVLYHLASPLKLRLEQVSSLAPPLSSPVRSSPEQLSSSLKSSSSELLSSPLGSSDHTSPAVNSVRFPSDQFSPPVKSPPALLPPSVSSPPDQSSPSVESPSGNLSPPVKSPLELLSPPLKSPPRLLSPPLTSLPEQLSPLLESSPGQISPLLDKEAPLDGSPSALASLAPSSLGQSGQQSSWTDRDGCLTSAVVTCQSTGALQQPDPESVLLQSQHQLTQGCHSHARQRLCHLQQEGICDASDRDDSDLSVDCPHSDITTTTLSPAHRGCQSSCLVHQTVPCLPPHRTRYSVINSDMCETIPASLPCSHDSPDFIPSPLTVADSSFTTAGCTCSPTSTTVTAVITSPENALARTCSVGSVCHTSFPAALGSDIPPPAPDGSKVTPGDLQEEGTSLNHGTESLLGPRSGVCVDGSNWPGSVQPVSQAWPLDSSSSSVSSSCPSIDNLDIGETLVSDSEDDEALFTFKTCSSGDNESGSMGGEGTWCSCGEVLSTDGSAATDADSEYSLGRFAPSSEDLWQWNPSYGDDDQESSPVFPAGDSASDVRTMASQVLLGQGAAHCQALLHRSQLGHCVDVECERQALRTLSEGGRLTYRRSDSLPWVETKGDTPEGFPGCHSVYPPHTVSCASAGGAGGGAHCLSLASHGASGILTPALAGDSVGSVSRDDTASREHTSLLPRCLTLREELVDVVRRRAAYTVVGEETTAAAGVRKDRSPPPHTLPSVPHELCRHYQAPRRPPVLHPIESLHHAATGNCVTPHLHNTEEQNMMKDVFSDSNCTLRKNDEKRTNLGSVEDPDLGGDCFNSGGRSPPPAAPKVPDAEPTPQDRTVQRKDSMTVYDQESSVLDADASGETVIYGPGDLLEVCGGHYGACGESDVKCVARSKAWPPLAEAPVADSTATVAVLPLAPWCRSSAIPRPPPTAGNLPADALPAGALSPGTLSAGKPTAAYTAACPSVNATPQVLTASQPLPSRPQQLPQLSSPPPTTRADPTCTVLPRSGSVACQPSLDSPGAPLDSYSLFSSQDCRDKSIVTFPEESSHSPFFDCLKSGKVEMKAKGNVDHEEECEAVSDAEGGGCVMEGREKGSMVSAPTLPGIDYRGATLATAALSPPDSPRGLSWSPVRRSNSDDRTDRICVHDQHQSEFGVHSEQDKRDSWQQRGDAGQEQRDRRLRGVRREWRLVRSHPAALPQDNLPHHRHLLPTRFACPPVPYVDGSLGRRNSVNHERSGDGTVSLDGCDLACWLQGSECQAPRRTGTGGPGWTGSCGHGTVGEAHVARCPGEVIGSLQVLVGDVLWHYPLYGTVEQCCHDAEDEWELVQAGQGWHTAINSGGELVTMSSDNNSMAGTASSSTALHPQPSTVANLYTPIHGYKVVSKEQAKVKSLLPVFADGKSSSARDISSSVTFRVKGDSTWQTQRPNRNSDVCDVHMYRNPDSRGGTPGLPEDGDGGAIIKLCGVSLGSRPASPDPYPLFRCHTLPRKAPHLRLSSLPPWPQAPLESPVTSPESEVAMSAPASPRLSKVPCAALQDNHVTPPGTSVTPGTPVDSTSRDDMVVSAGDGCLSGSVGANDGGGGSGGGDPPEPPAIGTAPPRPPAPSFYQWCHTFARSREANKESANHSSEHASTALPWNIPGPPLRTTSRCGRGTVTPRPYTGGRTSQLLHQALPNAREEEGVAGACAGSDATAPSSSFGIGRCPPSQHAGSEPPPPGASRPETCRAKFQPLQPVAGRQNPLLESLVEASGSRNGSTGDMITGREDVRSGTAAAAVDLTTRRGWPATSQMTSADTSLTVSHPPPPPGDSRFAAPILPPDVSPLVPLMGSADSPDRCRQPVERGAREGAPTATLEDRRVTTTGAETPRDLPVWLRIMKSSAAQCSVPSQAPVPQPPIRSSSKLEAITTGIRESGSAHNGTNMPKTLPKKYSLPAGLAQAGDTQLCPTPKWLLTDKAEQSHHKDGIPQELPTVEESCYDQKEATQEVAALAEPFYKQKWSPQTVSATDKPCQSKRDSSETVIATAGACYSQKESPAATTAAEPSPCQKVPSQAVAPTPILSHRHKEPLMSVTVKGDPCPTQALNVTAKPFCKEKGPTQMATAMAESVLERKDPYVVIGARTIHLEKETPQVFVGSAETFHNHKAPPQAVTTTVDPCSQREPSQAVTDAVEPCSQEGPSQALSTSAGTCSQRGPSQAMTATAGSDSQIRPSQVVTKSAEFSHSQKAKPQAVTALAEPCSSQGRPSEAVTTSLQYSRDQEESSQVVAARLEPQCGQTGPSQAVGATAEPHQRQQTETVTNKDYLEQRGPSQAENSLKEEPSHAETPIKTNQKGPSQEVATADEDLHNQMQPFQTVNATTNVCLSQARPSEAMSSTNEVCRSQAGPPEAVTVTKDVCHSLRESMTQPLDMTTMTTRQCPPKSSTSDTQPSFASSTSEVRLSRDLDLTYPPTSLSSVPSHHHEAIPDVGSFPSSDAFDSEIDSCSPGLDRIREILCMEEKGIYTCDEPRQDLDRTSENTERVEETDLVRSLSSCLSGSVVQEKTSSLSGEDDVTMRDKAAGGVVAETKLGERQGDTGSREEGLGVGQESCGTARGLETNEQAASVASRVQMRPRSTRFPLDIICGTKISCPRDDEQSPSRLPRQRLSSVDHVQLLAPGPAHGNNSSRSKSTSRIGSRTTDAAEGAVLHTLAFDAFGKGAKDASVVSNPENVTTSSPLVFPPPILPLDTVLENKIKLTIDSCTVNQGDGNTIVPPGALLPEAGTPSSVEDSEASQSGDVTSHLSEVGRSDSDAPTHCIIVNKTLPELLKDVSVKDDVIDSSTVIPRDAVDDVGILGNKMEKETEEIHLKGDVLVDDVCSGGVEDVREDVSSGHLKENHWHVPPPPHSSSRRQDSTRTKVLPTAVSDSVARVVAGLTGPAVQPEGDGADVKKLHTSVIQDKELAARREGLPEQGRQDMQQHQYSLGILSCGQLHEQQQQEECKVSEEEEGEDVSTVLVPTTGLSLEMPPHQPDPMGTEEPSHFTDSSGRTSLLLSQKPGPLYTDECESGQDMDREAPWEVSENILVGQEEFDEMEKSGCSLTEVEGGLRGQSGEDVTRPSLQSFSFPHWIQTLDEKCTVNTAESLLEGAITLRIGSHDEQRVDSCSDELQQPLCVVVEGTVESPPVVKDNAESPPAESGEHGTATMREESVEEYEQALEVVTPEPSHGFSQSSASVATVVRVDTPCDTHTHLPPEDEEAEEEFVDASDSMDLGKGGAELVEEVARGEHDLDTFRSSPTLAHPVSLVGATPQEEAMTRTLSMTTSDTQSSGTSHTSSVDMYGTRSADVISNPAVSTSGSVSEPVCQHLTQQPVITGRRGSDMPEDGSTSSGGHITDPDMLASASASSTGSETWWTSGGGPVGQRDLLPLDKDEDEAQWRALLAVNLPDTEEEPTGYESDEDFDAVDADMRRLEEKLRIFERELGQNSEEDPAAKNGEKTSPAAVPSEDLGSLQISSLPQVFPAVSSAKTKHLSLMTRLEVQEYEDSTSESDSESEAASSSDSADFLFVKTKIKLKPGDRKCRSLDEKRSKNYTLNKSREDKRRSSRVKENSCVCEETLDLSNMNLHLGTVVEEVVSDGRDEAQITSVAAKETVSTIPPVIDEPEECSAPAQPADPHPADVGQLVTGGEDANGVMLCGGEDHLLLGYIWHEEDGMAAVDFEGLEDFKNFEGQGALMIMYEDDHDDKLNDEDVMTGPPGGLPEYLAEESECESSWSRGSSCGASVSSPHQSSKGLEKTFLAAFKSSLRKASKYLGPKMESRSRKKGDQSPAMSQDSSELVDSTHLTADLPYQGRRCSVGVDDDSSAGVYNVQSGRVAPVSAIPTSDSEGPEALSCSSGEYYAAPALCVNTSDEDPAAVSALARSVHLQQPQDPSQDAHRSVHNRSCDTSGPPPMPPPRWVQRRSYVPQNLDAGLVNQCLSSSSEGHGRSAAATLSQPQPTPQPSPRTTSQKVTYSPPTSATHVHSPVERFTNGKETHPCVVGVLSNAPEEGETCQPFVAPGLSVRLAEDGEPTELGALPPLPAPPMYADDTPPGGSWLPHGYPHFTMPNHGNYSCVVPSHRHLRGDADLPVDTPLHIDDASPTVPSRKPVSVKQLKRKQQEKVLHREAEEGLEALGCTYCMGVPQMRGRPPEDVSHWRQSSPHPRAISDRRSWPPRARSEEQVAAARAWLDAERVWLVHRGGFCAARQLRETDAGEALPEGRVRLKLEHNGDVIEVDEDDVEKANPPLYDRCEDLAQLRYLNESSVLHTLRQRYGSNLIHTYAGTSMVVINPTSPLAIYSEKVIQMFKGCKLEDMPPHIYSAAQASYRDLLATRRDQSIVFLGRSGAGKTTNFRHVLHYLALAAGATNKVLTVEKLNAISTLLEAFGNSRTVMNTNATRFTQIFSLDFDHSGQIASASVQVYMPEKTRVVRRPEGEPNYHIFYQLLSGADNDLRRVLGLENLSEPNLFMTPLQRSEDRQKAGIAWARIRAALDVLGVSPDEQNAIWSVLAAIYHLGTAGAVRTATGNKFQFSKPGSAQRAATLLGTSVEELARSIFYATPTTPSTRASFSGLSDTFDEIIDMIQHAGGYGDRTASPTERPTERPEGLEALEGMATGLYSEAFNAIVALINRCISTSAHTSNSIMVVDAPGFQNPASCGRTSGATFQDLCHNYTQERFQMLFHDTTFTAQTDRYAQENIEYGDVADEIGTPAPLIALVDKASSNCVIRTSQVDLRESDRRGLLWLLDEEAIFPGASDQSFLERLYAHYGDREYSQLLKKGAALDQFTLQHFQGTNPVTYSIQHWLKASRENPVMRQAAALLQESNKETLSRLFVFSRGPVSNTISGSVVGIEGSQSLRRASSIRRAFTTGTAGIKRKSVCLQVKFTVDGIIENLRRSKLRFVHCLLPQHNAGLCDLKGSLMMPNKTNNSSEDMLLNVPLVRSQLRGCQILDALRLHKQGFPEHLQYSEFRRRFAVLAPAEARAQAPVLDERAAVEAILAHLDLDSSSYRLGLSQIFFRTGAISRLEEQRDLVLTDVITQFQAHCRGYLARKRLEKRKIQETAIRCIQKNVRKFMGVRDWPWWRLLVRVTPLLNVHRTEEELRTTKDELDAVRARLDKVEKERNNFKHENEKLETRLSGIDVDRGKERGISFDPSRLDDLSSDSDDEYFDVVAVPGLRPYLPAAQSPTKPPTPQLQLQPPHIPPTHSRSLPAVNKGMVENRMGNNHGQQVGTTTVVKQSSTSIAAKNTTKEFSTSFASTKPLDDITKHLQQPPVKSADKLTQQTLPSADTAGSIKSPAVLTSQLESTTGKEAVRNSPKKYQAPQPPSATLHSTDKQKITVTDKQDSIDKPSQHKMTDFQKARNSSFKKYAAPQPPDSSSLSRPSIPKEPQSSATPLASNKQDDKGISNSLLSPPDAGGTQQMIDASPDMLTNKQTVSITDKTLAKKTQHTQETKSSCSATVGRKVRAGSPVPDNTTVVGIKIPSAIVTGKLEIASSDGSATVKKDSTAIDIKTDVTVNGANEETSSKGISTVKETSDLESNKTNKQSCITKRKLNEYSSEESESKMANGLLVVSPHEVESVINGKDQVEPQIDINSVKKNKQNADGHIVDENNKNTKEKKGKLKQDEVNSVDSLDDRSSRCSSVVSDPSRAVSPDSSRRSGDKRSKSGKLAAIMNKWETDDISQTSEKGKSRSSATSKVGKISNLASVFEVGKSAVTTKADASKNIGKLKSPYSAPFSPERKAPELKTSNIAGINTAKFGGVTKFKKPVDGKKKEDDKNLPNTEGTKEIDKEQMKGDTLCKENTSSIKKLDEKQDVNSRKIRENIPQKNLKEERNEKKVDKKLCDSSVEKSGEKITNGDIDLFDSDISLTSVSEDSRQDKKKKKKDENIRITSANTAVISAVENGHDTKLHEVENSKNTADEASEPKNVGVKATKCEDIRVDAVECKAPRVKDAGQVQDAESTINKPKDKESKDVKDTESNSITVKDTRDEAIVPKSANFKVIDGKVTNFEMTDAKPTSVKVKVAKSASVKVTDTKITNSEVSDAKATSIEDVAKSANVTVTNTEITNSVVTDTKATSVKGINQKAAAVEFVVGKAANVEVSTAESKIKATESKKTIVGVTDAKERKDETSDIKVLNVKPTEVKTSSVEITDSKETLVKASEAKASSLENTDENVVNAKKINIEATDVRTTVAKTTDAQVTTTKGMSSKRVENIDSPNTSIPDIGGSCVSSTDLNIGAKLKTSNDTGIKAHTVESDVSAVTHASTMENEDAKVPESVRKKDMSKREMLGGIRSFIESVGFQFGKKSLKTENLAEGVHSQHPDMLNHVSNDSCEGIELLEGKPSQNTTLLTSDKDVPQKAPEIRQNFNIIPETAKTFTKHDSEVEALIREASYLIEQNKCITEPCTADTLHTSLPKVGTHSPLRKHRTSPGEEEEEVYVDAVDPSQLDTLMPLPKLENEREWRSRSRTPLEGPERSPSSRSVVAQTEALLSETDRLLRRSRSDKSLRRSYSRSLSSAALNKLAEVTADLSEEHNTAHLAGERLEAEQTERMKLEKEIERLQTDMRLMTTANGKLEMEKQALRSEVLTVANVNGDADHDDDDAAEASLYKRKYEWCLREIELLKKQLKQQQEDDLDHLLLTKKQLEKKVADAYEETEEQRQVVAQMKRKSQRLQAEMNDLKILLEEQTSRNNLLEKKQRKFDQDVMAVQEELRHERANKDKIQRERDQILSEKYSFEQEVSTLKLELELKEEKISALNRELEDLSFTGKAEEEVATLKKAKHDLELRVKDQEEELDDLAGQVQMLEGAKVRLEMSIEQMRKENRREIQQRDEELEEVRISAQKKVKALEAQLENEHEERTLLVREKHELERRLADLHDRAITHVDEDYVHKLKKELKKTKALLRDTQTMLEKSQSEGGHKLLVRQLKTQLEDAEFAKTAAIKARQCAEADLSELTTQLEEAQRARKEAEDRCARIAKDKAEIQTQLEENEEEVAEVMKKYKSVVSQLSVDQITLSEQSQQIAELEHEKQVLQERMLELSSKVEVLEGETANIHTQRRLEMKIKEVESKLELEQTTRQRLESQIGRLKDQIERLTTECDSARLKETQALEQSKRVSRQLREAKEDLAALQQRHTDATNKKGELEKQLELADSEVATLKSDLKLAFKRIEDLQQAIQGDINDSDSDLSDSDSDSDGSLSSYLTASLRQQRSSSNSTLRTPPSEVQQLERLEQPNSPCSEAMSAISEDLDDASTKESYA